MKTDICPGASVCCNPSWCKTSGKCLHQEDDRAKKSSPPAQVFGIIDPEYARIFTQARILAWQYGYACLAHGTFTRDLDLLLVPWADRHVPDAGGVVDRIADVCGLGLQGPPSDKPHGRKAWTLLLPGFTEVRWVDVSAFAPPSGPNVRANLDPTARGER